MSTTVATNVRLEQLESDNVLCKEVYPIEELPLLDDDVPLLCEDDRDDGRLYCPNDRPVTEIAVATFPVDDVPLLGVDDRDDDDSYRPTDHPVTQQSWSVAIDRVRFFGDPYCPSRTYHPVDEQSRSAAITRSFGEQPRTEVPGSSSGSQSSSSSRRVCLAVSCSVAVVAVIFVGVFVILKIV